MSISNENGVVFSPEIPFTSSFQKRGCSSFFCRGMRFRLSFMFLLNTLQFTADQVESPRTIIACVICYKNIEEEKIFLLN